MKKIAFAFLMTTSPAMATGMLAELDLDKPVYYHKEVILMSPCKQFGGLYLQIEDVPNPLKKMPYYAPKMKTRSIRDKSMNVLEPQSSGVFNFMKELHQND